jgi:hypothetical protein
MLLAALALYVVVAQPRRQAADSAAGALRRAEASRAEVHERLERVERRLPGSAAAAALLGRRSGRPADPSAVRREVLDAVAQVPVRDVRLKVDPGKAADTVSVRVEARGRFLDLVALSTRLAHPDLGLALERVTLAPPSGPSPGAQLVVEATALGGAS